MGAHFAQSGFGPDFGLQLALAVGLGVVVGALFGYVIGKRSGRVVGPKSLAARSASSDGVWEDPRFWSEEAERRFGRERRLADREIRSAGRRGESSCLVSFEDVTGELLLNRIDRGVATVPLESIIGSVDKPCKFTLSFHPAEDRMKERWKRVFAITQGLVGYEPVELYLFQGDYFVVDGHYRVSVIKALGGDVMRGEVHEWV